TGRAGWLVHQLDEPRRFLAAARHALETTEPHVRDLYLVEHGEGETLALGDLARDVRQATRCHRTCELVDQIARERHRGSDALAARDTALRRRAATDNRHRLHPARLGVALVDVEPVRGQHRAFGDRLCRAALVEPPWRGLEQRGGDALVVPRRLHERGRGAAQPVERHLVGLPYAHRDDGVVTARQRAGLPQLPPEAAFGQVAEIERAGGG